MLAKALAGTAENCTFMCVTASTLQDKYVGGSEKLITALFATARMNRPFVIFIDEVDALMTSRLMDTSEHAKKMNTQFFNEMDGFESKKNVLVIAATNLPMNLDASALRRFKSKIYIGLPNPKERAEIFMHHVNKLSSVKITQEQAMALATISEK